MEWTKVDETCFTSGVFQVMLDDNKWALLRYVFPPGSYEPVAWYADAELAKQAAEKL